MQDLRRLLLAEEAVLGGRFSGIEIVRSNDQDAVDYVTKLIEEQLASVEASKHDIGVTRKSSTKTAAENAAIGWLAQTVVHNTGKPFARQVAKLAEVAFDLSEVTEDRVRKVLKTRLQKVVRSTPK
jgi:predicted nucleotide-binding protein